jgi:hypothetical protein
VKERESESEKVEKEKEKERERDVWISDCLIQISHSLSEMRSKKVFLLVVDAQTKEWSRYLVSSVRK